MRAVTAALLVLVATSGDAVAARSASAAPDAQPLTLIWEDVFNAAEQAMLGEWVERTRRALEALVGPYPMNVRVHFHRRDGAGEPVPWAHTQRQGGQAVHLHVDPAFTLDDFLNDWTAPHEFSHLMLPYVGRRNAWFSEGFASYLQYPVMARLGVLSTRQARQRLDQRMRRAERDYPYPDQPFVEAAPRLYAARRYPVMYWGGAAYFDQVDRALRDSGSSLIAVLRQYVACCRRDRAGLDELIGELDAISGGAAFRTRYAALRVEPGFPAIPSTAGG